MEYTKDMLIGEILERDSSLSSVFLGMGMHCLGCPSARNETLEQACMVHGEDVQEMLTKLNGAANAG